MILHLEDLGDQAMSAMANRGARGHAIRNCISIVEIVLLQKAAPEKRCHAICRVVDLSIRNDTTRFNLNK